MSLWRENKHISEVKSCQEFDIDPILTCKTPLGIVKSVTGPPEATRGYDKLLKSHQHLVKYP